MKCASAALRPALVYLRAQLFDPDLSIETLIRRVGIRPDALFARFAAEIGASPARYMARLRYDTAARLVASSDLALQAIAGLVGIAGYRGFGRAFRRRFGVSASAYRERARERGEANRIEAGATAKTLRWLSVFDAWAEAQDATDERAFDRAASERRRAEQIWDVARTSSDAERRTLVTHAGRRAPHLAEMLFEKSRVEGRGDRAWGIRVAESALAAIPDHACGAWSAEAIHRARIRAWSWLGNARGLALDFPGAAAAFERARQIIGNDRPPLPAGTKSEVDRLEAGLYWQWSQAAHALDLADSSVQWAEEANDSALLVSALRRRSAIYSNLRHTKHSILDLERARELLGPSASMADRALLAFLIAGAHEQAGDATQAKPHLEQAEALVGEVADPRFGAHLDWLQGRVDALRGEPAQAVEHLELAISFFKSLDCRFEALMASVDLSGALLDTGDSERAVSKAHDIRPALGFLGGGDEWQALVEKFTTH